jgi:sodium transport system permease protein
VNGAGIVFRKELLETLRDRRTLLIMIVVPVLLYPALLVISEQLALFGARQLERAPARVGIQGEVDPGLMDFLHRREDLVVIPVGNPEQALRSDSVGAVGVFGSQEGSEGTQAVTVLFDGSDERSVRGRAVLSQALGAWGDSVLSDRILARGLPQSFAFPLAVADSSVARPEELGGAALGRFLPMLLILITLLGAFYPAIDLAAGEKERGTLETLLTAPVPPEQIVVGKFMTVAVVGLVAAALNLASMLLTFQTGLFQLLPNADIEFGLPVGSVLVIFSTLVPLAVLFGALFLGIAVRSRSFKEAQNALTPVYMLVLIPALLPLFPGIEMTPILAVMPVAGVALFFRELMSGEATLLLGFLAFASTLAYTSAALYFAADAFGREEVLFGEGADGGAEAGRPTFLEVFLRRSPAGAVPSPGATLAFLLVVAALFFYVGVRVQVGFGEVGLLLSEFGLLLLPVLLFIKLGRFDAKKTLSLGAPRARDLLVASLIILGGTPLAWLLAWLQGFVLPVPWEFLEEMSGLVQADSPARMVWLLTLLALTPAICEEALFRGVLLAGTRDRMSPVRVILLNGLVFGAFHLSFYTAFRLLPTAWLGILLAWVVLRTRSIWASALMHFVNNGSVVVMASSPWIFERFSDPNQPPPLWILAPAALSLAVGLSLLEKGRLEEKEVDEWEGWRGRKVEGHRLQR